MTGQAEAKAYCIKCKKFKLVSEFYKHRSTKNGLNCYCKLCDKKLSRKRAKEYGNRNKEIRKVKCKEWRKQNPDKKRNTHLLRTYGITIEQYNKMLEKQNGVCAVCGLPERIKSNGQIRSLSVDHNHRTGKVRGLLCHECNRAIGCVKDNKNLLLKLAIYLENSK